MGEKLLKKRFLAPLALTIAGNAALFGCGTDQKATVSNEPVVTDPAPATTGDSHVELYPIPTGRSDRSEVFKVINLDDGRRIECIETHILKASGVVQFDQDCFPAAAPTTTSTQPSS